VTPTCPRDIDFRGSATANAPRGGTPLRVGGEFANDVRAVLERAASGTRREGDDAW